jgi:uncharacterized membrane protein
VPLNPPADGVITALGFSVAAALLKTIGHGTWHQIGTFAFVVAFRTAMKHFFAGERRLPGRRSGNRS